MIPEGGVKVRSPPPWYCWGGYRRGGVKVRNPPGIRMGYRRGVKDTGGTVKDTGGGVKVHSLPYGIRVCGYRGGGG